MLRASDRRLLQRTALLLPAVVLLGTFAGCSDHTRAALPDWTNSADGGAYGGSTGTGTGPSSTQVPPNTLGIRIPPVDYPARMRVLGTADQPCAVPVASAANAAGPINETACIIDMDELDLWVEGLKFEIVVPQGACDYVKYAPYIYQSWPTGDGPKVVSYTVQQDGTFSDEVNSQNGTPICEFDYSKTDVRFPNCCLGSYTLTIKSAQANTTTTKTGTWGTLFSSRCYDGAAFLLDGVRLNADGYPLDPIYFLHRSAAILPIHHAGLSTAYPHITVPLANYWNEGPSPAAPVAVTAGVSRSRYVVECVDNADEVLGRIQFDVREWNEKAQLAQDGDPNTTGTEVYWNTPINDYNDWADLRQKGIEYTRIVREGK